MNQNVIRIDGWSNPVSAAAYAGRWQESPELRRQYELGAQCGGCSFFAPFNADWGLCCHAQSCHHLETVFEHFTCENFVGEGWGPHSFTDDVEFHCRCRSGVEEATEDREPHT